MSFCIHCGKQIPENMRFCKYCGAEVCPEKPGTGIADEEQTALMGAEPAAAYPEQDYPAAVAVFPPPQTKKHTALWIVAALLLVLLIGTAVCLIYNDNYKAILSAMGIGQDEPSTVAAWEDAFTMAASEMTEAPTLPLEFDFPEETSPPIFTSPSSTPGSPVKAAYAMASSERKPMPDSQSGKTATYGAGNAIDGSNTTAWVEGVGGDGVGEWIQINLPQTTTLTGLRFKSGYWKSERHLLLNTRVARILVTFSDGASEEFELFDPQEQSPGILSTAGQEIIFSHSHASNYLKVTILAVYLDGTEDHDTCISEIVPLA